MSNQTYATIGALALAFILVVSLPASAFADHNITEVTTDQNEAVEIILTGGSWFRIIGSPANGELDASSLCFTDSTVTYTPDVDYVGSDSFTYRASSNLIACLVGGHNQTIAITVEALPEEPEPEPESESTTSTGGLNLVYLYGNLNAIWSLEGEIPDGQLTATEHYQNGFIWYTGYWWTIILMHADGVTPQFESLTDAQQGYIIELLTGAVA